ncbi:MepB family protein [Streptomyces sp. MUM 203J]|uniref:MepB family protein n=1 Tax=Streptomyces sp. MUM 203J TaxID=2791990 RepID=UPI001F03D528|nr:MepB family protein [Streptomyces sp. MUM 203J]MCH0540400.1 MepB family protein [Streptomyces sp. MUM 203J]
MAADQPWAGLHEDLLAAWTLVYGPGGFACSRPVPEPEGAEYAAHGFTLDGLAVRFRVARTTPAKAGQFVTVWQRSEAGPIRPFDAGDGIDLVVVSSRDSGDGGHFGQFVFPREALCERGVMSRNGSGGKRGFRVYPPWVTTASRQAGSTQAWQVRYFLRLAAEDGAVDTARAEALYHP